MYYYKYSIARCQTVFKVILCCDWEKLTEYNMFSDIRTCKKKPGNHFFRGF